MPCFASRISLYPSAFFLLFDVLKQVTLDRISKKFFTLLLPDIATNAQILSEKLEFEDGVGNALSSFYRHLHIENMICDISIFFGESQLAHVWCSRCGFKMTREVSECIHNPSLGLLSSVELSSHQIVPCTYVNWSLNRGPNSASEGVIQGLGGATHELVAGITDTVLEPISAIFKGHGLTGAVEGMVQGLRGFIISPISGGQILLSKVSEGFKNSLTQPVLPDPNNRFTRDGSIQRPDASVYGNPFSEEITNTSVLSGSLPEHPPGDLQGGSSTAKVSVSQISLSQSGISRGLDHSIPLEMSCVLSPQRLFTHTTSSPDQCSDVTPDVIELDHILQRTLRSPLDLDLGEATPQSFSSTDSHTDLPQMNFHAAVLEEHIQQHCDDPDDEEGNEAFSEDGSQNSDREEVIKVLRSQEEMICFTQVSLQ